MLGRLAYTMPAVTDLLGGAPIEAISTHYIANNDINLKFAVRVANTVESTESACAAAWE